MIVLLIKINYPQQKYFNLYQSKSYIEFTTRFGIADTEQRETQDVTSSLTNKLHSPGLLNA